MGGFLIRRLLPAAVLVPVVLGWLRFEGQRAGLYGTGVGVLLTTTANVLIIAALILWRARLFDRLEARRCGARPERKLGQHGGDEAGDDLRGIGGRGALRKTRERRGAGGAP